MYEFSPAAIVKLRQAVYWFDIIWIFFDYNEQFNITPSIECFWRSFSFNDRQRLAVNLMIFTSPIHLSVEGMYLAPSPEKNICQWSLFSTFWSHKKGIIVERLQIKILNDINCYNHMWSQAHVHSKLTEAPFERVIRRHDLSTSWLDLNRGLSLYFRPLWST